MGSGRFVTLDQIHRIGARETILGLHGLHLEPEISTFRPNIGSSFIELVKQ
jgi:hypothetical protein